MSSNDAPVNKQSTVYKGIANKSPYPREWYSAQLKQYVQDNPHSTLDTIWEWFKQYGYSWKESYVTKLASKYRKEHWENKLVLTNNKTPSILKPKSTPKSTKQIDIANKAASYLFDGYNINDETKQGLEYIVEF